MNILDFCKMKFSELFLELTDLLKKESKVFSLINTTTDPNVGYNLGHTIPGSYGQNLIPENSFEKAVIVASDGDYASLVKLLKTKNKLETILSPAIYNKCSILLKRTDAPIVYLNDKRSILEKTPGTD